MNEIGVFYRTLWGIWGGLLAVIAKFLGQDHYYLSIFMETRAHDKLNGMMTSYIVLSVLLCVMGGIIAAATIESNRLKLLAVAVAAPAMVTTWLGGAGAAAKTSEFFFSPISSAHAQDANQAQSTGFWEGFKVPFGVGKDNSRYNVVVGSYKDKNEAARIAEKLGKDHPTYKFAVGPKAKNNEHFPVIVGEDLPFPEAVALRTELAKKAGVTDSYLRAYPPN